MRQMPNAKLNLKTDAATSMLLATNYVAVEVAVAVVVVVAVVVAIAIAYGSNKRLSVASCLRLLHSLVMHASAHCTLHVAAK